VAGYSFSFTEEGYFEQAQCERFRTFTMDGRSFLTDYSHRMYSHLELERDPSQLY